MKVKSIAALLSLCAVSIPVHSEQIVKSPILHHQSVAEKIDLNKVELPALIGSLKGIGKKRAEAIIAYRESHHGFKSLAELAEVKGLGAHFMEVNQDKIKALFVVNPG